MLTNYLMFFLITIMMSAILTHPDQSVSAAASGLTVWFNSVVPSLFPFMVLTGLLIHTGLLDLLSQKLKRIPLLGKLPVTPIFALITGLLCGYPMGVRTVSELKTAGQLNDRQAGTLYRFVNQPGPMFVLGYAFPLSGLAADHTGDFLTAFYGGVGATAILALMASWVGSRTGSGIHERGTASSKNDVVPSASSIIRPHHRSGFLSAFEHVLMSSMTTLAKIGGYMMVFSLIAALIGEFVPGEPAGCLLLSGMLEMTSGLALIPTVSPALAPWITLGFISFGGLSVAAQSFTLGGLSTKEQLNYLVWKLVQMICTVCIYYFIQIL